jgi:hypothetical protein
MSRVFNRRFREAAAVVYQGGHFGFDNDPRSCCWRVSTEHLLKKEGSTWLNFDPGPPWVGQILGSNRLPNEPEFDLITNAPTETRPY